MFCSRNKGADKDVRCADCSSHVTKSGYIHLQTCGKQSEFRDVPITDFNFTATVCISSMCLWAVKALAIFRGCAGSSEPSLLA